MTAEQFAYWMQGFAELSGDEPPTPAQWKSMREHLQTVFVKVTPPFQQFKPVEPLRQFEPLKTSTPGWYPSLAPTCSAGDAGHGQLAC